MESGAVIAVFPDSGARGPASGLLPPLDLSVRAWFAL